MPRDIARQRAWNKKNLRFINGARLLVPWKYFDPYDNEIISLGLDDFLTQPFSNGPHRCARYPGRELMVPRALLRRMRATVRAEIQDKVLLGLIAPRAFHEKPGANLSDAPSR